MLKRGYKKIGATALADALSSVFDEGISVQTAHKWVSGQSIPRTERVEALAKWLEVSPHWLQYGPDPQGGKKGAPEKAASSKSLAERFNSLTTEQRLIVLALLQEFERLRSK